MLMKRILCLACALAIASCGGLQRRGERGTRPIDHLRAKVESAPDDPALALDLAAAEHLYDGGDPARARAAVERARKLAPSDLRLHFIEAEEAVLEGEPARALTAYLALLEGVPGSRDPLAPLLAEAALWSLVDMNDATDDYRAQVQAAFAKLEPQASALGLQAAHQLRMALSVHAAQSGERERAEAHARAAGCVQQIEVAGPFGPRELLGFDRPIAAEAAGPFAREYDLGPGRGVRAVRTLSTRRCAFGLGRGAHDALPGTNVVRAEVETAAGLYAVRIESPNTFALAVDGREVARVDLRTRHNTGVRYVPVELSAGKHEIKVKLSSRHPNPVLSLALVKSDPRSLAAISLPKPQGEFAQYLAAKLSLARGDVVGARELLRKLGHAEPTAHWLVLEAATALADPLRSGELRRDRARELLVRAERQNERAWYPVVGQARLASAEGRTKEAIEALRAALPKWPNATALRTSLIEQLRIAGYVEEADRLTEELAARMPNACAIVNLSLQAARSRGRMSDIARLSDRMMACDATSTARLNLLKTQLEYERAAAELLRLEALGDPLDEAQVLENELERARLLGDEAKVRALRERRTDMWIDRPEPVLDRVDGLLSKGDRARALSFLASAIEKNPADLYELRRVHDALSPNDLFRDFRKRGDEIIRAFEATDEEYAGPEVLVLDYTVVRLFEDGSSADLTHNIVRVQSQEAVDQNGEFGPPEGARLLRLQTIKADGTRLEPDNIPGKSTWSLPNLAPGDYMEFEFVRGESPSVGFPGGFLGDRFYFKNFEVPFHHSELVVVMPAGMEPVLDPRGPLPEVRKETRDGLTVLRWVAEKSRALTPEPNSVAQREFLPSINLGVKVSWEAYLESLRDLLVDKEVYDPSAQEFVLELLGSDVNAPVSVRANKLYRWVTDQVEGTEEVFGSAAAMLAARTGNRERVLKYMLALAGIESELVLVRGAEADHTQAALPDPETYGYLVLRVATERGPMFVHAGARHAPFGFLPPQIRGEQGLVVNSRAERTTLPPDDLARELRTIDIDVSLSRAGAAKVHVRETHRGGSAVEWRNDLDAIPASELERRFEQSYAANVIPGAKLTRLAVEARDDPEAPLVLDYEVETEHLGQQSGGQQRIAGLFPALLSARYARTGARTTTALIAPGQAADIRTRVSLPEGARVVSLPKAGKLESPKQASFEARGEQRREAVELVRSLRLPLSRVTPEEYPGFASFCRGADALDASELVVELPAAP